MRILACTCLIVFASCNNQPGNTFTINGKIKGAHAAVVYLQESGANAAPVIVDSGEIKKDGSFEIKTLGKEESLYSLRTANDPYPFALLINDSKKITLNVDLTNPSDNYSVSGSSATEALKQYDQTTATLAQKIYDKSVEIDSLMKAKAPDSVKAAPYGEYYANSDKLKSYTTEAIQKSTSPVFSLYALGAFQRLSQQLGLKGFSTTEIASIITEQAAKFPQHEPLQALKKTQRSSQAPEFSLPDTSGTAVALSSFRGKYVLVDFWASWCRPCREENPNVVKAFNRFKDKNFTVLGVSLDKTKEAWLKAIQADGLTWTHVSDLQYWNNAAAALYGVQSIPYNVLVDPKGTIIGENLRGEELEARLADVLK